MMPIYDYVRKDGVNSCVRPRNMVELHDALREIADKGSVTYPGRLKMGPLTAAIESMGWYWDFIGHELMVTNAFTGISFSWTSDSETTKVVFDAAVTNWETLVKLIQSAGNPEAGVIIMKNQMALEARNMELLNNMLQVLEFVMNPDGEPVIYVEEV